MVNVSVVRLPEGRLVDEKRLEKPGRLSATVRSAEAEPLLPALEVRSPVVFVWVPTVLLVTFTVRKQEAPAPRVPSLNVIVVPPSGAVKVPPQVEVGLEPSAIVTPAGRVSVNARFVTGEPPLLLIVKTSVELLPGPMVLGWKALLNSGGPPWAKTCVPERSAATKNRNRVRKAEGIVAVRIM